MKSVFMIINKNQRRVFWVEDLHDQQTNNSKSQNAFRDTLFSIQIFIIPEAREHTKHNTYTIVNDDKRQYDHAQLEGRS